MSIILDGTNGENFPTWTTGTRPASPIAGQTGYNTSLGQLEVYNGTAWGSASISASGLPVVSGGTGQISALTAGGVVYSASTTAMGNTAIGTSGQPLISGGAGAPSFGTVALGTANTNVSGALTVTNGGTGNATATAYAVQCGGTTSTGAHQSIASVGTTGQVLTSNGAGALPTFQAASGGGQLQTQYFATSTTWTCPAGVTKVMITCIGAGGGYGNTNGYEGGLGGVAYGYYTVVPATVYTITIGTGGAAGGTGSSGTSTSFGALCSATGGQGGQGGDTGYSGLGTGGTLGNFIQGPGGYFCAPGFYGTAFGKNSGTTAAQAYSPSITNSWNSHGTVLNVSYVPGVGGGDVNYAGYNGAIFLQYVG
jgi:hypothetical protein